MGDVRAGSLIIRKVQISNSLISLWRHCGRVDRWSIAAFRRPLKYPFRNIIYNTTTLVKSTGPYLLISPVHARQLYKSSSIPSAILGPLAVYSKWSYNSSAPWQSMTPTTMLRSRRSDIRLELLDAGIAWYCRWSLTNGRPMVHVLTMSQVISQAPSCASIK